MHTNDVLNDRRLGACVKREMHFTLDAFRNSGSTGQRVQHTSTAARERVTFSDGSEVVAQWSICMLMAADMKMSLFWTIFGIENCIPRSFSATIGQTGTSNACHNTTQRALSTHLCSFVSALFIPDIDEMSKNRLISPGRGETGLNSSVCEMHDGRYPTDNISVARACCAESIERGTAA